MNKLTKTREFLVNEFVKALKEERIPWERGWRNSQNMNAISNYKYHGINNFILTLVSQQRGYEDPRWITFKQVSDNNWKLIDAKGKGVPIEFWSPYDTKEKKKISIEEAIEIKKEEPERIKNICQTYYVFNASLVDGIPPYQKGTLNISHNDISEFLANYLESENIQLFYRGDEAYYSLTDDAIVMPSFENFKSESIFFDTLAHEIAHSTGHPNRLHRDLSGVFGSINYAKEELRAEISSAFLNAELSIPLSQENVDRHKAYIQSWIEVLEKDPRELFKAITDAETIVNYICEKGDYEFYKSQYLNDYDSEMEAETMGM